MPSLRRAFERRIDKKGGGGFSSPLKRESYSLRLRKNDESGRVGEEKSHFLFTYLALRDQLSLARFSKRRG